MPLLKKRLIAGSRSAAGTLPVRGIFSLDCSDARQLACSKITSSSLIFDLSLLEISLRGEALGRLRQTFGDLAGLISLVNPAGIELFSVFVVFLIYKVGVTECFLCWGGGR